MKQFILAIVFSSISQFILAQTDSTVADIKMISEYGSENPDITNILQFQKIDYFRIKFIEKKTQGKIYHDIL
jgi:hypothetical protein